MNGFMVSYMADAINHDISTIQIHHSDFKTDFDIKFVIPDGKEKAQDLNTWDGGKGNDYPNPGKRHDFIRQKSVRHSNPGS